MWENRERRRQRERSINYRQLARMASDKSHGWHENEYGSGANANGSAAAANVSMDVDRYLTYGFLHEKQIAEHKLMKDRQRRRPVSSVRL